MRLSVAKILGVIFLSIMLCSACGSGGGGGGEGEDPTPTLQPDPTPDPGVINLEGKWHHYETVIWSNCSDRAVDDFREYDVDITQIGTDITIKDQDGVVINATISGDTVTGTGSFTDSGCKVVIDLEIIVYDDEISAYGYATYTYTTCTSPSDDCSFETDIDNITKTS